MGEAIARYLFNYRFSWFDIIVGATALTVLDDFWAIFLVVFCFSLVGDYMRKLVNTNQGASE